MGRLIDLERTYGIANQGRCPPYSLFWAGVQGDGVGEVVFSQRSDSLLEG